MITGKDWNEGLIGAVVGGGVYGGVLAATGNVCAAGFTSAAAESLMNETSSYIPKIAQANGQTVTKKITTRNAIESAQSIVKSTAINGIIVSGTGKIAAKFIPTNNGWFKPQKFMSSFVGKYAKKSELQTATQSGMLFGVECFKHSINQYLNERQETIMSVFR